jgi:hypothetical protein
MHQFLASAFKPSDASSVCYEKINEDSFQALNRFGGAFHQSLISFCRILN